MQEQVAALREQLSSELAAVRESGEAGRQAMQEQVAALREQLSGELAAVRESGEAGQQAMQEQIAALHDELQSGAALREQLSGELAVVRESGEAATAQTSRAGADCRAAWRNRQARRPVAPAGTIVGRTGIVRESGEAAAARRQSRCRNRSGECVDAPNRGDQPTDRQDQVAACGNSCRANWQPSARAERPAARRCRRSSPPCVTKWTV